MIKRVFLQACGDASTAQYSCSRPYHGDWLHPGQRTGTDPARPQGASRELQTGVFENNFWTSSHMSDGWIGLLSHMNDL